MVSDDVDNFLAHLSRKRARDEEENKKKMTIILSTITCIIAIVGAWVIGFDYDRSKETISWQFNSVLRAMMRISQEYLKLQPCDIGGSERDKWKWFENCIGALDGTHIPVTMSVEDRPRYRNRKGDISTNVLGVCDPYLKFIYVLSRWEGSASDSRVLRDALARDNLFQVPSDNYYLVDAYYANGPGFLAHYRGTRYHLNEWIGNNRPENYKELFNLRHSIARNVIERIINACFVLHNFIRIEQHNDHVLQDQDMENLASVDHEISNHSTVEGNANRITSVQVIDQWTTFRDTLAMQMFLDYQARGATNS
ncbi:putative nuclease HARBI1 [Prunus dulcis]|uniref:putative nuclease HARBI1 n=1 Tax=Prunus dulcis TaxID=3755 RepID=UPI001482DA6A|nr:putative nuclease HARBI1 [Prunus dulcis]